MVGTKDSVDPAKAVDPAILVNAAKSAPLVKAAKVVASIKAAYSAHPAIPVVAQNLLLQFLCHSLWPGCCICKLCARLVGTACANASCVPKKKFEMPHFLLDNHFVVCYSATMWHVEAVTYLNSI